MLARARPILDRLPAGRCVMVEVGVYLGLLSEHLLDYRRDLILHAVDNWLPADEQPRAYRKSRDPHADVSTAQAVEHKSTALARLRRFGHRAVVHDHGSPAAATSMFMDPVVDLVFLDARHDREGLEIDLAAWWPKVAAGGWLGGHDYGNETQPCLAVKPTVDDWARENGGAVIADGGHTWWVRKP